MSSISGKHLVHLLQTQQKFDCCIYAYWNAYELIVVFFWRSMTASKGIKEKLKNAAFTARKKWLEYLQGYEGEQVETRQLQQTKCWKVSNLLTEWLVNTSWSNCSDCNGLVRNHLLPKAQENARSNYACACQSTTVDIIHLDKLPPALRGLTCEDQQLLAFFHIPPGPMRQANHGYHIKTSGLIAILCDRSPLASIQTVQDKSLQRRLLNAYSFLVQCPNSHYSDFVKRYDHGLFHRRL